MFYLIPEFILHNNGYIGNENCIHKMIMLYPEKSCDNTKILTSWMNRYLYNYKTLTSENILTIFSTHPLAGSNPTLRKTWYVLKGTYYGNQTNINIENVFIPWLLRMQSNPIVSEKRTKNQSENQNWHPQSKFQRISSPLRCRPVLWYIHPCFSWQTRWLHSCMNIICIRGCFSFWR